MPSQSKRQTGQYDAPAGILGLTHPDVQEFRPHKEVLRVMVAENLKVINRHGEASLALAQTLTEVVASVRELEVVRQEGVSFFFMEAPTRNQFFGLSPNVRRQLYREGRVHGFDSVRKKLRDKPMALALKWKIAFPKDAIAALERCQAIETKRVEILRRVAGLLRSCVKQIEREGSLRGFLKERTGVSQGGKTAQVESDLERTASVVTDWADSTDPCRTFALNMLGDEFVPAVEQLIQVVKPKLSVDPSQLARTITTSKRSQPLFATNVTALLDKIPSAARSVGLPTEYPDRHIYRTLFTLRLLQGELPQQDALALGAELKESLTRVVRSFQLGDYLGAVERHPTLSDDDKELIIRYCLEVQTSLSQINVKSASDTHLPLEKRSEVRRHIKEVRDEAETESRDQLLQARVDELRDSEAAIAPSRGVHVSFYPSRVESDFRKWLVDYTEEMRVGIWDLIERAADGSVAVKPIKTSGKIWELRCHEGGGIRIYVTRPTVDRFVVLGFGLKCSQKRDIARAFQRLRSLESGGDESQGGDS